MQAVSTCNGSHAPCFDRELRPLLPQLRAASLRLTRNRSDAEDLLQETVLRAWRFRHRFEPGTNLRAWVHRILRNTFASRWRRRRREHEWWTAHGAITAERLHAEAREPAALRDALSAELASGLSTLPPHMHAVLWAVAVDELSYRETAERLACPVGTVMSRLHRARDAMRPRLLAVAPRHA